jgi:pectate lyase
MLSYALVSLALSQLATAAVIRRAAPVDELVGFGAAATGGGSGEGTTVTSCSEFESALETGGVIKVSGTLSGCGTLDVPGDTSIIGVGADSGIYTPLKYLSYVHLFFGSGEYSRDTKN